MARCQAVTTGESGSALDELDPAHAEILPSATSQPERLTHSRLR